MNGLITNVKYKNVLGVILVFTGAVLFSCKAILVKLTYQYHVDTVTLLTLRMVFSLPFYIVIVLISNSRTEKPNVTKENWLKIIFLGIIGYYLASYFDFEGLQYITAGLERLILFIYPTLVVLLSAIFYKKPIQRKEIIALLLTYGGIGLVMFNDLSLQQNNVLKGSVLIFFSALTYAMYLIGSGRLIPVLGTIRFTAYAMIVSTVAVLLHYIMLENVNVFNLPSEVYFLAILMAVFATVIPSFFISEGIRMIGSSSASIVGSVGPISTIILAYIFLDEKISINQLSGTVLVLAGVLIVGSNNDFIEQKALKVKRFFLKKG